MMALLFAGGAILAGLANRCNPYLQQKLPVKAAASSADTPEGGDKCG